MGNNRPGQPATDGPPKPTNLNAKRWYLQRDEKNDQMNESYRSTNPPLG